MEEAEAEPEDSQEEEEPRRKKKWLKPFLTKAKVSLNTSLPVVHAATCTCTCTCTLWYVVIYVLDICRVHSCIGQS